VVDHRPVEKVEIRLVLLGDLPVVDLVLPLREVANDLLGDPASERPI